jgi:hypothetical protein
MLRESCVQILMLHAPGFLPNWRKSSSLIETGGFSVLKIKKFGYRINGHETAF